MTPASIIRKAEADGLSLALSPAGTIKAFGDQAAVNRWLPVLRENKPAILAALAHPAPLPPISPASEARRRKVRAMLARDGGQYAILVEDPDTDPVVMALATPAGTCELLIPRDRYDPFHVLEMVHRWNTEPDPAWWWRVAIQEPGGRTIEVDTPRGYTLHRLERLRGPLPQPWVHRETDRGTAQAPGTGQPR